VQGQGGYREVLTERPIRGLLAASLAGRVGFLMLPLGMIFLAGSAGASGALIAAFSVTSALAPARGRVVDRHGPRALTLFAVACTVAAAALVAIKALDAPDAAIVALGGLIGLTVPPLGPFTRAVLGRALRERTGFLQRTYGLDSAGEETALIFAPLIVALLSGLWSVSAALLVAAAAMLAGTAAAARSPLAAGSGDAPTSPAGPVPAAVWLLIAAIVPVAAALGAVDIGVTALAREQGHLSTAGVLLAAMAVGTVAGSLLAGRWRWAPQWRVAALQAAMAAGLAAAAATSQLALLGILLTVPGAALGALFATIYANVGRLAPGTRIFAWLVTANNGGLALGAAVAGTLPDAALWFAAICAAMGIPPGSAAAKMSARGLRQTRVPEIR
jgi:hypothetical protein